ncbi:hypothetical protein ARTSIC4J27_2288 [Pseudarthrobacter siccitolerans]|jgi:hypothetical protein|uniref:Uncharacterized protein n=1 Tax=Pseudarthrobacter siccitolerans TaxID=861266 RepID=A0A024H2A7_9MICC|nr:MULTISPECIES: hypothetical protein [Micrococcaceae]MDQ0923556.1 hypothetical protein [Pseudarthrobacter sp. W1I19]CCQ46325.1 hypothetical protein ARTSIC4J27_2288 [Pseudarthrobacter siccitolerans]SEQ34955.1 hypothetical protein SAMN05444745_105270 [Arthrobacter sp. OV608]
MSAVAEKKTSDGEQKPYVSPAQERVIVRAARLRLSTDKKQGLESPAWVKKIAKRPL